MGSLVLARRCALLAIALGLVGLCGCGVIGSPCTPATQAENCPTDSFCKVATGNCSELAIGVCTAIPEACTLEYAPVCGCDGETYGNECAASAEGVSIDHDGTCEDGEPRVCGGLLGLECQDGEFCNFAIDALCGAADQTGLCDVIPEVCPEIFAPVCGCDDQTYDNECFANAEGVSVASEGACDDDIVVRECGGLQGLPCEEGEFCNFTDGSCGAADQLGICEVIPEACDDEFDPVCGCDEQTYSNSCEAAAAGVSVVSEGECSSAGQGECGGLQGLTCAAGEYCNFTDGSCGAADQLGTCEAIPSECDAEFDPVCGCDDQTYSNACEAAAAGVSVVSEGACPGPQ